MPDDRYQRWIDASSASNAVEPFMIPLVQGLRRFDCRLIHEDARFAALNQEQSSSAREKALLTDRVTLSYFSVLAAYELVRTLDQRWRMGATTLPDEFGSRVTALKRPNQFASASRFPFVHESSYELQIEETAPVVRAVFWSRA